MVGLEKIKFIRKLIEKKIDDQIKIITMLFKFKCYKVGSSQSL